MEFGTKRRIHRRFRRELTSKARESRREISKPKRCTPTAIFSTNASTPPQSTTTAFETDNFVVNEGEGSVTLTVVRQGDLSGTSAVNYSVPGGFAIPGQDYQPVSGTLTFNPGETVKTFSVPLIDDGTPEGIETFTVELTAPVGTGFGTNRTTIVTVFDNRQLQPTW